MLFPALMQNWGRLGYAFEQEKNYRDQVCRFSAAERLVRRINREKSCFYGTGAFDREFV